MREGHLSWRWWTMPSNTRVLDGSKARDACFQLEEAGERVCECAVEARVW